VFAADSQKLGFFSYNPENFDQTIIVVTCNSVMYAETDLSNQQIMKMHFDSAMDLTVDEKLVASAMAGLKRPRYESPQNATSPAPLALASVQKDTSSHAAVGEPNEKLAKIGNEHYYTPTASNASPLNYIHNQNQNTHMASPKISAKLLNQAPSPLAQGTSQFNPISNAPTQADNGADLRSPDSAFTNGKTIAHQPAARSNPEKTNEDGSRELNPAPYFYYRDFSQTLDDDPLTPLTPLARVPIFPAKMHAILSRADLADVVTWLPHGRSWKVLKPREFEIRVIPAFFEHSKFSSFIRQANGWGFRRITRGKDRNTYYHELFMRGLPHLCKRMKRPGVSQKQTVDVDHEPDFYKISQDYPVPKEMENSYSIMLPNSLIGRPHARMPVGMSTSMDPFHRPPMQFGQGPQTQMRNQAGPTNNAPRNPAQIAQTQFGVNSSTKSTAPEPQFASQTPSAMLPILPKFTATPFRYPAQSMAHNQGPSELQQPASHHQLQHAYTQVQRSSTLNTSQQQQHFQQPMLTSEQAAAFQQALSAAAAAIGSDPTSQFAAGFAAAAALSNPTFQRAFNQAFAHSNSHDSGSGSASNATFNSSQSGG
jgi:hypothetical protein